MLRAGILLAAMWLAMAGLTGAAEAHIASTSYLTVAADGSALQLQWEVALRDLDYAIGLDADADGRIIWGALRRQFPAIEAYMMPRLKLQSQDGACTPSAPRLLTDLRGDGAYAVLRFSAQCRGDVRRVTIGSTLMFDLDPLHRALLDFVAGSSSHLAALSPAMPEVTLDAAGDLWATFGQFFRVGVAHIFSGPDHLLFVAMLLFPAMFWRQGRAWRPVPTFWPAFLETVRILSAFTLAHALTVTLATLGWIALPARVVDGTIALTIAATALDNVVPILPQRRWMLAFGFGLIHGMGFATALGPLSLPPLATAAALLAFNSGVEAAQLVVAALVLPLGFVLRNIRLYPLRLIPGASGVAAIVALAWFAQRTLGLPIRLF